MNKHLRTCAFCFRRAAYDEFSDGSVVYIGILACAECLQTPATEVFRTLLEESGAIEVLKAKTNLKLIKNVVR